MSAPLGCCVPCSTPELVLIPGTAGANGINGYTAINGNAYTVPALGGFAIYNVDDSRWISAGMFLFIEGAGTFLVIAVPSDLSISVQYCNYSGNTNAGIAIADGSLVSPSGAPPLGGLNYFGAGDPNGAIIATRPAFFYDALGSVWIKTNAATDATGWVEIIAAP